MREGKGMKKRLLVGFISLFLSLMIWAEAPQKNQAVPLVLQITQQTLDINGKPATVFNIAQPDGTQGFIANKGQWVDLTVQNKTNQPTGLHWHGMIIPNDQDGVPFVTQNPIPPGAEFHGKFQLLQSGTFWVHSPYKSQLQNLMAAPVIVVNPKDPDLPIVTMLLQDYAGQDIKDSYVELRQKLLRRTANIQLPADPADQTDDNQKNPNQIVMDAYLTNRHTLDNPEIVNVTPGSTIRLSVINAAANSNFVIDLGQLNGALVNEDSEPLESSLNGSKFEIAQGQRLDILLTIPEQGDGYYPILAQAEGTTRLTGLILAVPGVTPPLFNLESNQPPPMLDYVQELQSRAKYPLLSQNFSKVFNIDLVGNMLSYLWTMNNEVWPNVTPLSISYGDRVKITFNNKTDVTIPIHLHGHVFQIIGIDGKDIDGAIRDTTYVLPHSKISIAFDADNPGSWLLEGLIPFLPYGRAATLINYQGYPMPIFKQKDTGIPVAHNFVYFLGYNYNDF